MSQIKFCTPTFELVSINPTLLTSSLERCRAFPSTIIYFKGSFDLRVSKDPVFRDNTLLAGVGPANVVTHGIIILAVDREHSEAVGIPGLGESRCIPRRSVVA